MTGIQSNAVNSLNQLEQKPYAKGDNRRDLEKDATRFVQILPVTLFPHSGAKPESLYPSIKQALNSEFGWYSTAVHKL